MTVAYSVASTTARDDAAAATFTVKRSGTSSELAGPSSIRFQTADHTAKAGTDYVATAGTLQFSGGVIETVVPVMILKEAYESASQATFLLEIVGFGAASGTIVPDGQSNRSQIYLCLPEDNDPVTVPTSEAPGINLEYQALYNGFSDPPEAQVEMPLAYLRIGHARPDMNDYERAVVNSDAYVPEWDGFAKDGTPIEGGAYIHMMLPRGVSRPREDVGQEEGQDPAEAMQDNSHLDGIFLHSNRNYIATVAGNKNEIVKGDVMTYVGGEVREHFMGPAARWSYMSGPGSLRWAEGIDEINGQVWNYSLSGCKNLGVSSDQTIDYRLGPGFSASATLDISASNGFRYDVSNALGLEVKGVEFSSSCNIFGEYEVNLPFTSRATTEMNFEKETIESITLSVNPASAAERSTMVQAAAVAVAGAGIAATFPGWAVDFDPDGTFYRNVNAEQLSASYNGIFTDAIPQGLGILAGLNALILLCAAYEQKALSLAPSPTFPKISMTPAGMTLSCGPTQLVIDELGITMTGATVNVKGEEVAIFGDDMLELISADGIALTCPESVVNGNLEVVEEMSADVVVGETIVGTMVEG